jgi:RNA polymerase sigma-70 factor (ECF subfamily)
MSGAAEAGVSDEELLRRVGERDEAAFGAFVARHRAGVYRFVSVMTPGEAEDALQETFLAVWRGAARFRGESSGRTWVYAIARNAALRLRARRAAAGAESLEELGLEAGWGGSSPEEVLGRAERERALWSAMAGLAEEDREVLLLRDVEGVDGETAARLLGLTLAAMKTRLHRARLRLMGAMRRKGAL